MKALLPTVLYSCVLIILTQAFLSLNYSIFSLIFNIHFVLCLFILHVFLHSFNVKQHSLHEEIARDFRFSMACSSVRSQAAEDAMRLPPPPSLNCLSSGEGEQKQSFSASLAYAPCLPAPVSVPVMNENHIDKDVLQSLNQSLSSRGMLTESKHTPVVGDSEKKATPSMSYTRTQDYNARTCLLFLISFG